MSGESPFWVLFDTATVPDYYADVHKLLALPSGAAIRYDYRDVYLTEDAMAAVGSEPRSRPVLVIYAQWGEYVRGEAAPPPETPSDQITWQAMRHGKMLSTWREGEYNYFQFSLSDYPTADASKLAPIRAELDAQDARPYRKWVALSMQSAALASIKSATPAGEWQTIVDTLAALPMQFHGDKFWRVSPPVRSGKLRRGARLRSVYKTGDTNTPERVHEWIIPEQSIFSLPLTYREPAEHSPQEGPQISVETDANGPLHAPQPNVLSLRRNATVNVRFESKHTAQTERKLGHITLASQTSSTTPGVTLTFEVRLARWKQILGGFLIVLALAGGVIAGIATRITTSHRHLPEAAGAAVLVVLLLALGTLLYTGKLPIKT